MFPSGWNFDRFVVDLNVGHRARWLRFKGFDTLFCKGSHPGELLKIARSDGRGFLTRNLKLLRAGLNPAPTNNLKILYLKSPFLEDPIRQIFQTFHISSPPVPLTRCSLCNTHLQKIPKEKVRGRVPYTVFETQDEIYTCSTCDKIYWEGIHMDRMKERIKKWKGRVLN